MKKIAYLMVLLLAFTHLSIFAKTKQLKVIFYNIQSRRPEIQAPFCQTYFHDVRFKNNGKVDIFSKQHNPYFHDLKLVGTLEVKPGVYVQQDLLTGDFKYKNKNYHLINTTASLTVLTPLMVRGIISNLDCRAAYLVVEDNPNKLGKYTKV